jgi:VIT1/CCC1 family predicted Fe2+/Mn2+ transporter
MANQRYQSSRFSVQRRWVSTEPSKGAIDDPHTQRDASCRADRWLRAAVLGANDGIISTASLILGVASAAASQTNVLSAGLVAGAMSTAAGEYVSVSSQSDTENADLAREMRELANDPSSRKENLPTSTCHSGVEHGLARQVAEQLIAKDALGAHAHDELGISEITTAHPVQAALTSAATFSVGAAAPLAIALVSPSRWIIPAVSIDSLIFLAVLGTIGAKSRRRKHRQANHPCDFLGRSCDGPHGRDRCYLWHRRVRSAHSAVRFGLRSGGHGSAAIRGALPSSTRYILNHYLR